MAEFYLLHSLRCFTLKVCFCWMIELNIIANLHSYLERGTKQKRAYNYNPRVDRRLRLYNMGGGRNLHSGNHKYGSVQTSISTSIPIFEKKKSTGCLGSSPVCAICYVYQRNMNNISQETA